jgi:pyrroline-5-carboxylate reductase
MRVPAATATGRSASVTELRIGMIGSGNMASAMVAGWVRADPAMGARIHLTDRGSGRARRLADIVGNDLGTPTVHADNRALVQAVDIVLLCVKPIDIEDVLREISDLVGPDQVVASVAAGVQTATMENLLDDDVPVLRLMPNVPVRVNSGTLVYAIGRVGSELVGHALELFQLLGACVELKERLFDAATALSGSGPAFFGLVVEAFEDAAIVAGLSAEEGRELAVTTRVGTAELLMSEGMSCSDLRRMVTSPGGTAATGLAQMERGGVRGAIIDTVVAARDRARELG